MQGYLCVVLHAHLPFVRHPEHERFLEENWLFEAITESYLPLIQVMDGWLRHGMDTRLTITLSPTLCCHGWRPTRPPFERKFWLRATITEAVSGSIRAASGSRNAPMWRASSASCRKPASVGL